MPVSAVKSKSDERAWKRAKLAVRKQYPDAKGKRYWRLVMSLYQKMRGKTSESDLDKAIAGHA